MACTISKIAADCLDWNIRRVVDDPNPPRLRAGMHVAVLARHPSTEQVLLGGLGAMGVGQNWSHDIGYKDYPGFAIAAERDTNEYWDMIAHQWVKQSPFVVNALNETEVLRRWGEARANLAG